ncbi:MAG: S66 peptidase family protein [Gammaproteobacteria bacterium]
MHLPIAPEGSTALNRALPTLAPGSVVDVIAPGSACSQADLEAGLAVLESWGLKARVPRDLFGPKYIYAHDDDVRWRHLRKALVARDSRAVWCVRGGYGSLRLLDRLGRLKVPPEPKLLIGFSDVTALHIPLTEIWRWPVLHGPVLAQVGRGEPSARHLAETRRVLLGQQRSLEFDRLELLAPVRKRTVRGRLAGGNLKTVQSLHGTPWALKPSPSILFFEDVNERGYSLDRILQQLRLSGVFDRTRAMVLGDFARGVEPNGRSLWRRVFSEFAQSVKFPVLAGMPVGHGRRLRPLPLGLEGELALSAQPRLSLMWD